MGLRPEAREVRATLRHERNAAGGQLALELTDSTLAEIGSFARHETATRTCARGHVLKSMNTTQDK